MYNPSLSGNAGNSAANSRLFIYEVIGLRDSNSSESANGKIRRSGSQLITVPYQRMNQEMRRIANLGGKILSIRPFAATSESNPVASENAPAPAADASAPTAAAPAKKHADVPVNIYRPNAPFVGKCISNDGLG
jgi:ferredoxin--NADP+ reductase